MGRHVRTLIRGALALALLCLPVQARLGLIHETTFTVPSLTEPIIQIAWDDIDKDGQPEVLIGDQNTVVLWSLLQSEPITDIAVDSVLALVSDTVQSGGYTQYRLELGDVNRDSLADGDNL